MKIDPDQLKKLSDYEKLESAPASVLNTVAPDELVTAIVQVTEPGYVPEAVTVRAQIDPTLFTAEFPAEMLSTLESDPQVKSVALSRRQQMID